MHAKTMLKQKMFKLLAIFKNSLKKQKNQMKYKAINSLKNRNKFIYFYFYIIFSSIELFTSKIYYKMKLYMKLLVKNILRLKMKN